MISHFYSFKRSLGAHQPQGGAEPTAARPAGGLPLRHAALKGLPHPAQAALRAARPARQAIYVKIQFINRSKKGPGRFE